MCLAMVALVLAGSNYSHAHGRSADLDINHVHSASDTGHVEGDHSTDAPLSQGDIHCGAQILALCSESPGLVFTRQPAAAVAKWLNIVPAELSLEPPPPRLAAELCFQSVVKTEYQYRSKEISLCYIKTIHWPLSS